MNKKITSKDIANHLGISRSTLSFIINGKSKEMRISDELTNRTLEYVKSINYTTNSIAKSLKTGKSYTIGLIVADISNAFFSQIAYRLEKEASKKGYYIMYSSSNEDKKQFNLQLENFINRRLDGLILVPPVGCVDFIEVLHTQKIPFVLIDRSIDSPKVNSVNINNYKAAYDATIRLIKNNRKNIAIINVNNQLSTMHDRTMGYLHALSDNHISVNQTLIAQLKFSNVIKDVKSAVEKVVQKGADGILFTTNKLSVSGLEKLKDMGVKIPHDLSVVSFDDTPVFRLFETSITTIKQPVNEMCKAAIDVLLESIDNKNEASAPLHLELDSKLILRDSCS
ncbi:MAG: LacI family transcriptional regulator [Crocinitomicaceae bacterium]|nr:LacI family transcriptional regulator [Crocinitomicaceae bacterium]